MGDDRPRRFLFTEGRSDKFWEVEVIGAIVRVRFGRRGGAGETQDKPHRSTLAARAAADRLIAEKIAKGYREETAAPVEQGAAAAAAGEPEVTRHGDLIGELRSFLAGHAGPQRALAEELRSSWLGRLTAADESVRISAARAIERALRSPKLAAERDAILAALARPAV